MQDPIIFPFEYFRDRVTSADIEQLRDTVGSGVYVSLISARCGSTLFSRLCQNIKFGKGEEPFNERHFSQFEFYNPDSSRFFLEHSMQLGTIDRRFYFQISPQRFRYLQHLFQPGALERWISGYTIILRRNILAQAISLAQAIKSGHWHTLSESHSTPPTELTDTEIFTALLQIHHLEVEAKNITKRLGNVLTFFYEDIISSPIETLRLFTAHCGSAHHKIPDLGVVDRNLTLRQPTQVQTYVRFLDQYPAFTDVISERLSGKIPHAKVPLLAAEHFTHG